MKAIVAGRHRPVLNGRIILLSILLSIAFSSTAARVSRSGTGIEELGQMAEGLEVLTARVGPAVVQIFASGYQPNLGIGRSAGELITRQRGSGSGVLVDPAGYIVTNNHVVHGATRVRVLLAKPTGPNDRGSILPGTGTLLSAEVVGRDLETDLAVLKITHEGEPFPFLEFSDSDDLRAGRLVLAVGSPFGLENSVSLGVVSATARQLQPEDPMIYIQTDATINPGNSGGPLVDTNGRIVGINTLIFSQSGGSVGIGFAAPSNIVRTVYDQLRKYGRVVRGQIGIEVQTVTPILARAMGLSRTWGAIVSDVSLGSPGQRAGLLPGDLIEDLDGKRIENGRQFEVNLYRRRVGDTVRLGVNRDGQELEFRVDVVERSDDGRQFAGLVTPQKNLISKLGILALDLDASVIRRLPPLRKRTGVLVAARAANAPQQIGGVGFLPGDIIHAINGESIEDLRSLLSVLNTKKSGDALAVQVENGGEFRFVVLELD